MDKFGNKTGGRVKGTLNKKSQEVEETCKRLGLNVIERMAHIAMANAEALGYVSNTVTKVGKNGETYEEDRITIRDSIDALKFLGNKIYPDVKSMTLENGPDGQPLEIYHHMDKRELLKLAREFKK